MSAQYTLNRKNIEIYQPDDRKKRWWNRKTLEIAAVKIKPANHTWSMGGVDECDSIEFASISDLWKYPDKVRGLCIDELIQIYRIDVPEKYAPLHYQMRLAYLYDGSLHVFNDEFGYLYELFEIKPHKSPKLTKYEKYQGGFHLEEHILEDYRNHCQRWLCSDFNFRLYKVFEDYIWRYPEQNLVDTNLHVIAPSGKIGQCDFRRIQCLDALGREYNLKKMRIKKS